MKAQFSVGLDVGSTTVKACVSNTGAGAVVWQDYQRHETKQPEKVLEFLGRMEAEAGINQSNARIFMTGSGGTTLAERIGAKFVQEVTAVSLAVEKLHPEVYSVIELGGQSSPSVFRLLIWTLSLCRGTPSPQAAAFLFQLTAYCRSVV